VFDRILPLCEDHGNVRGHGKRLQKAFADQG
jgi:hypothetical protein